MRGKNLASAIAKREGKKHQASVADIREILKIQEQIFFEDIATGTGEYFKPWFLKLVLRLKKVGVNMTLNF